MFLGKTFLRSKESRFEEEQELSRSLVWPFRGPQDSDTGMTLERCRQVKKGCRAVLPLY